MTDALQLWTIYDHPTDFPGWWIARRHDVGPTGSVASGYAVTALDLQDLREMLRGMGLTLLGPREPDDAPAIVETWI